MLLKGQEMQLKRLLAQPNKLYNKLNFSSRGPVLCYVSPGTVPQVNCQPTELREESSELDLLGWDTCIKSGLAFTFISFDVFHPDSLHLLEHLDFALHSVSLSLDPNLRAFFLNEVSDSAMLVGLIAWIGVTVAHVSRLPSLQGSNEEKDDYFRASSLILLLSWTFVGLMAGDHPLIIGILKDLFKQSRPSPVLPSFSFPSGHTAASTFLSLNLTTVILPTLFSSVNWRKWAIPILLAFYSVTASGRILGDAHWFSDTLASLFLSLTVVSFMREIKGLIRPRGPPGVDSRVEQIFPRTRN